MTYKDSSNLSRKDKKILEGEVTGVIQFFKEKYKDPDVLAEKVKNFSPILSFFVDYLIANRNEGISLSDFRKEIKKRSGNG